MRGVRLSHRNLRSYGLPQAARPLAARALREARELVMPIGDMNRHRNSEGRDLRGYLHSVAVLQAARDLAQQAIELCEFDEGAFAPEVLEAFYMPEHSDLWFQAAVAIDNRLGVHGLSVEDAG